MDCSRSLSEFTVRFVSLDMCIILLIFIFLSVFFNQLYEAVCVLLVSRVWRNEKLEFLGQDLSIY